MTGTPIRISKTLRLDVWYERTDRSWYGRYIDNNDNQCGLSWFAFTRDEVLVFRPTEPAVETV